MSNPPADSRKALERELCLLGRRLERTRLAMRLLEEAKDRYDALYFNAINHLAQALELNEKMVSVAPLGVAVFVAATGKCIMANAALAHILGAKEPSQLHTGDYRELPNLQGIGLLEAAERTLSLGREQRVEVNLLSSFGKRVWMDCVMAPFVTGSETHLMVMVNDTTERHAVEETQRHAQKMESLALMAGGIAHDFNNLFQVILANLERLRSGGLDDARAAQAFERVFEGLDHAQALSGRLLEYSGKGFRKPQSLELQPFLAESLPRLCSLAGRELLLEGADGVASASIQGDPEQLMQAMANLVVNAAESMEQGQGSILLSLSRLEDPSALPPGAWALPPPDGPCLCVAISDQGCGIPGDQVLSICDPFFTTKEMGRGLGLSVAMGILRGHGAGFHIESRPGLGSTFRALFPVGAPLAGESPATIPCEVPELPRTILVVDDDPDVRSTTAEILQECFEYQVLEAVDGLDAIEVFRSHADRIQVILMDASMPRMNGGEALDGIKAIRPDVKAILCSGYSESMNRETFQAHGFLTYLKKPYRMKELKEALDYVLGIPLQL